jgi:hypothetical protein
MAHYINWINGMKLGKAHFLDLQSAVWASLSQSRSLGLNSFTYGIVNETNFNSFNVEVRVQQPNIIEVDINSMLAVTANGNLISIEPSDQIKNVFQLDQLELKDDNSKYYAIVTADLINPVPYGTPDSNEVPVRLPYLKPRYTIDLISENLLDQKNKPVNVLPVAAFLIQRGRIKRIDEFVPPSARISDSEDTSSFTDSYVDFLYKLEDCCVETVAKARNKERVTNLYKNAVYICERLIPQIESTMLHVKLSKDALQLVALLESCSILSRNIHNSLQIIDPKEREEFIHYIAEQTSLSPGEYVQVLNRIFQAQYDHWNMSDTLTLLSGFCKITLQLFTKIKESEYVGKKKDAGIIIDERVSREEEPVKKKGWQF